MSRTDAGAADAAASRADTPRRLNRIESLLVRRGVVSLPALQAAKQRQRGAKKPLVDVLLEQQAVDEELLVEVLAEATGMDVIDDAALRPDPEVQDLVPMETVQRLGLLPLRRDGDRLVVATSDPLQIVAFDELARRTRLEIEPVFARPSALRDAIRSVRGEEEALHELLKHAQPAAHDFTVEPRVKEGGAKALALDAGGEDAPTIQLVNLVLSDAITRGASDIHLEAEQEALRVRFRVDGELKEIVTLPAGTRAAVLSRIKIIAGLDIIEVRRPQDGRAKVSCGGRNYDLRVSTLPSYFGEKAVIRVLDAEAKSFDLDRAGMEPEVLATWRELIERPHGLLLMTGPTGSGKTSTLYASLLEIRDPTLNIVTVEDPVEYQFPGIVHVPVRSDIGVTFAAALRSILRQDPDVVLVGEIRDAETAKIAVQASMTGHLVLSTLHTNDAYGALPRLLDLGVERAQLASCLLGVMAQRLARTVCSECAVPAEHDAAAMRMLGWSGPGSPGGTRRGVGCRHCHGTGSKGRTALTELVVMTPALGDLITAGASEDALRRQMEKDGTRLLVESGLAKVLGGQCIPEEVLKVAAPESGDDLRPAARAPRSVEPEPAAPASCGSCDAECQPGWRVCPMCGEALAPERDGPAALVCDDDAVSRKMAVAALRRDFGRVETAENGQAALDAIAVRRPDLLIVDMKMPGLSGIDVIRELRSNLETASLPIIMLTGATDEDLEEESLTAGADDYLNKPITLERLRARAAAVLRARARAQGAAS